MELAETQDDEKNAFVVCYTVLKTRNLWKRFETFTKAYDEFKKEILNNYPSAIDTERGTVKKLRKALKTFDDEDIGSEDQDELMKLTREMHLEAAKLLVSGELTDWEAVPMFLNKLDNKFREWILGNLESNPPQLPTGAQIDTAIRTWTLKEVMDEAKWIATRQNLNSEFFGNESNWCSICMPVAARSESPPPWSMASRPMKKEVDPATMLEAIKSTVVNMMDQLDARTTQHFSKMEEENSKKLAELEAFCRSLPGKIPGATDSQSLPANHQVRFSWPLMQNDLCHYCDDTGHWSNNCPHRLAHIESGTLKIVGVQEYHADGTPIYRQGNKSRCHVVEEGKSKWATQPNTQVVYSQQFPGMYPITPDDRISL
ncbi:hypothetical protein K438DRAFT_1993215 [Mycena galopus ATCC 62051]|nr:hypothetical protein K438DRAFT_1993215 [Mycena galopus ATCC 62051]